MFCWMVHPSYEAQIDRVFSAAVDPTVVAAAEPSAAEPLDTIDGVARIQIRGMLMAERSRLFDIFRIEHTAYSDISAQLREAEGSDEVRAIELRVNSGGGLAGNALVNAADLIFNTTKPTTAVVEDLAASAAYWLASQADEIVLQGPASTVGSIGVAIDTAVFPEEVSIASTEAPKKRPDLTTESGKAVLREFLDDLHGLFVAAISRGRGVDADTVNERFGRGASVIASRALANGMVDRVISAMPAQEARDTLAANMDRETLKAEHPALFAQIKAEGAAAERDRVSAHLLLAGGDDGNTGSGDWASASKHIQEGREVDSLVTAAHANARMNRDAEKARIAAAPEAVQSAEPAVAVAGGGTSKLEDDINACFDLVSGGISAKPKEEEQYRL